MEITTRTIERVRQVGGISFKEKGIEILVDGKSVASLYQVEAGKIHLLGSVVDIFTKMSDSRLESGLAEAVTALQELTGIENLDKYPAEVLAAIIPAVIEVNKPFFDRLASSVVPSEQTTKE